MNEKHIELHFVPIIFDFFVFKRNKEMLIFNPNSVLKHISHANSEPLLNGYFHKTFAVWKTMLV